MIRPRTTAPLLTLLLLLAFASGCSRKATQAPPAAPPATPPASTEERPAARAETPPPPAPEALRASDFAPVFFAYDSHALDPSARAALDRNAKLLRDRTDAGVTIEGHCDERGTVEYNQALGERRAQAAADYLAAAGVSASRIQVVSYGKERPFDEGHDEAAWAKNRRAHFVLR